MEEQKKRGRPKNTDSRTAAERKRDQRKNDMRDSKRATTENINRKLYYTFKSALDFCRDHPKDVVTVTQLRDIIAASFPEEERHKVYKYFE